jgi:hypothetical protein
MGAGSQPDFALGLSIKGQFGQSSANLMTKDRYNWVKIVLFLATENFDKVYPTWLKGSNNDTRDYCR